MAPFQFRSHSAVRTEVGISEMEVAVAVWAYFMFVCGCRLWIVSPCGEVGAQPPLNENGEEAVGLATD